MRDRREDIAPLARHFLTLLGARSPRPLPAALPRRSRRPRLPRLAGQRAELRNAVQRAVVLAEGMELSAADFSFLRESTPTSPETKMPEGLTRWEQAERANILAELSRQSGNKTRTARVLGIAKSTLFEKLKKYGIGNQENDR